MVVASHAMAQSTAISGYLQLSPGETKSVSIRPAYIEQVFVQAEGASRQDAMFEVWANGKPKGSIYVPGRDPSYIVTIRETVSSLEFRHVSGGSVTVHQVRASMNQGTSQVGVRPSLGGYGYSASGAVEIAQRTVAAINDLKPQANYAQLGQFLLPIRKSAARLYAIGASRTPYSMQVRNALIELKNSINNASGYLDQNLETDSAFDLTTELMTIKETIDAML